MISEEVLTKTVEALWALHKKAHLTFVSQKGIHSFLKRTLERKLVGGLFFVDKREGTIGQYSWSYELAFSFADEKWQGQFIYTKKGEQKLKVPVRFKNALDEYEHKLSLNGKNEEERRNFLEKSWGSYEKSRNLRTLVNLYSQPFFIIKKGMKDEDILAYLCLYALRENFFEDQWPYNFLRNYISHQRVNFNNRDDREEAVQAVMRTIIWRPDPELVLGILQKFGVSGYVKRKEPEPFWNLQDYLAVAVLQVLMKHPPNEYDKIASQILRELSNQDTQFSKNFLGWSRSEKTLKQFIIKNLEGFRKKMGLEKARNATWYDDSMTKKKKNATVAGSPKTVDEVAAELDIDRLFIYRAIWKDKIKPKIIPSVSKVSAGKIKLKRVKKNYELTPQNVAEIEKLYKETRMPTKWKEYRKELVQLRIERAGGQARAARRWIKRRLDKGMTLKQIEKEIRNIPTAKDRSEKENAILDYLMDTEGLLVKEAEAYLNLEKSKGFSLAEITKRLIEER